MSLSKVTSVGGPVPAGVFPKPGLLAAVEGVAGPVRGQCLEKIRGGTDGDVYLVAAERGSFVLRFWEGGEGGATRNEQRILQALQKQGIDGVQEPYLLLVECAGGVAALRRYIDGQTPGHLSVEGVERIGRLLAALHSTPVPENFQRSLHPWPLVADCSFLEKMAVGAGDLGQACDLVQQGLVKCDADRLPMSLIHDDVSLDNLVEAPDRSLTLIDWSDAHVDASLSDIAVACSQLGLDPQRRERLFAAYRSIRPLPHEELRLLPLLEARRQLFILHYMLAKGIAVSRAGRRRALERCRDLLKPVS